MVADRCLAWSAVGLLLPPLVFAIVGAAVSGDRAELQLTGALGGLGIGMAGAILVAQWIGQQRGNGA